MSGWLLEPTEQPCLVAQAKDKCETTPLCCAAQKKSAEALAALLARGANANAQDFLGNTPLMSAIMLKHTRCAELLLPHLDLSLTCKKGRTAFHVCVGAANEECFKLLLPLVADVDVRTVAGVDVTAGASTDRTALHVACVKGQFHMVKKLLKRGASRTAKDSKQQTPLHFAAQEGQLACLVLLLGPPGGYKIAPADVNAATENGATPLHSAAFSGNAQCCGALIGGGALLDARMNDGATPLMVSQHFHSADAELHALLSGRGPAQAPGMTCDQCGVLEDLDSRLKSCSLCNAARYCGVACQTAAWSVHKKACRKLVAAREEKTRVNLIPVSSAGPA
jgi:ankyrin repeat protein